MLNRRPRTAHTSRLVRVQSVGTYGCPDDRTSFYAPRRAWDPADGTSADPLSTTPGWEIHRDSCRCPYCR